MTATAFKDLLVTALNCPVYHVLAAPEDETPVLLWQQLPGESVHADDVEVVTVVRIQLDYYTTTEYDGTPVGVQLLLQQRGCTYRHEETTFDPDREEWRFTWTVEFISWAGEDEETDG